MEKQENAELATGALSHLSGELDVTVKDNFAVSISDGYCEWTYKLTLSDKLSIAKIAEKLCDAFGVEVPEPTFRSLLNLTKRVRRGNPQQSKQPRVRSV